ncbi:MAG: hypothetical protein R3324_14870, partial [Halobacteriales archaeon]|nr:hypothetical protein [Halobacteriales archaeon]
MNRPFTLVVTVLVVVGTVGLMPGALAQTAETTATPTPTETTTGNETVAPGEQMAGVVGVGEAEVSGEVSARAFAFAVANASSNESRAAIIAQQVRALDRNVASLRERQEELRRAHENGSISDGR